MRIVKLSSEGFLAPTKALVCVNGTSTMHSVWRLFELHRSASNGSTLDT